MRLALFISPKIYSNNILDLVNNLPFSKNIDVYTIDHIIDANKYRFNTYIRCKRPLLSKYFIFKEYDTIIVIGNYNITWKYANSVKTKRKIFLNLDRTLVKLSSSWEIYNNFEDYAFIDIKRFKKEYPSIRTINDKLIVGIHHPIPLELSNYIFVTNIKDEYYYTENDIYIYLKKDIEDLDRALKSYMYGALIYEEKLSNIIGVKTQELSTIKYFKKKRKKDNKVISYNRYVIKQFLKVIKYNNY